MQVLIEQACDVASPTLALMEMRALLMRARTSCGEVASWPEDTDHPQAPSHSIGAEREYLLLPTKA